MKVHNFTVHIFEHKIQLTICFISYAEFFPIFFTKGAKGAKKSTPYTTLLLHPPKLYTTLVLDPPKLHTTLLLHPSKL